MLPDPYTSSDGLALADLVRRKEVSPKELVEAAINQIEQTNPKLNAVVYKLYEEALEASNSVDYDAPFCGVPTLIKDLGTALAGTPMGGGSRLYKDYVPDHDSEVVKRLRAAGLLFVGKSSAPEFGVPPCTESEAYGVTRNPWNLDRTSGGSSGGAGTAVAARMVPVAHASDGGGSIRIPASCCGLFGLKPTRDRTPLGPDSSAIWQGFGVHHALTRSVRDSAALLDVLQGPEPGSLTIPPPPARPYLETMHDSPGKLRIAFTTDPLLSKTVHPDCVAAVNATVKLCEELGHEVVEAAPTFDPTEFAQAFMTIMCGEVRAELEEAIEVIGRKATPSDVEPTTWVLGMLGDATSSAEFVRAQHKIQKATRQIGAFFQTYDLFLSPTLAEPPIPVGSLKLSETETMIMKTLSHLQISQLAKAIAGIERIADTAFNFVGYTPPFNATGQPAMSVPLHWNADNLPIGVQFVGRYGREDQLLQVAAQLEEAKPWALRRPKS